MVYWPFFSEATKLDPVTIDDAIEWLATRDLVKALGGAGTSPFQFMQVQLRPEGRAFFERMNAGSQVDENPVEAVALEGGLSMSGIAAATFVPPAYRHLEEDLRRFHEYEAPWHEAREVVPQVRPANNWHSCIAEILGANIGTERTGDAGRGLARLDVIDGS
jgi:hypothetical protein